MSTTIDKTPEHWDVVVVGSGFGGSVAALRLSEKGYKVLVVESGRRFRDDELPKTSWRLPKFLWAPAMGMFGIQRLALLNDVLVLSGAGVGGGSLVYGNTLYEPLDEFYADKQWAHITDWRDELAPHYQQAKRMLGVVENPVETPADQVMLEVAKDLGVADTFHRTQVGVLFGEEPGVDVEDPFFGGAGPARTTCDSCGSCMTGCRLGAKNTLPKNYLHLAEGLGATIQPLTTVTGFSPLEQGGYRVTMRGAGPGAGKPPRTEITADHVILAAGTLGTQKLLHTMKDSGHLPALSDRLGALTRTNSESILTVEARDLEVDYSHGPAITSSIHPTPQTHVEPVRYGPGSNFMGMLSTMLTEGDRPGEPSVSRPKRFLGAVRSNPASFLRSLSVRRWSQRTTVMLVMQSLDNSLNVTLKRNIFGQPKLASTQGTGEPNPAWIPEAHEVTKKFAEKTGGEPRGTWTEALNIPMTAHILGGAAIGDSPQTGVIDPYHRVYNYEGIHVVDGAAVSANLGVNPSLTITAQAERAMALWPNKGEADPRPAMGEKYRLVEAVRPVRPAVPEAAPAALVW
ncbi:MAG: GMC family oxidoreductase [Candidatus Nanopelagicales bacterium]